MKLENMNWPAIAEAAKKAVVVLPLGSIEQHGPHLGVATDSVCAASIAAGAEAERPMEVLLCPALVIGSSHHHRAFAGTLSCSPELYSRVIVELVESILRWGATRVVLLNGHGGNITPVRQALSMLGAEKDLPALVVLATYWELAGRAFAGAPPLETPALSHACEYETSLMLELRPEAVNLKTARPAQHPPGNPYLSYQEPLDYRGVSEHVSFHQVTSLGNCGRPELATVEKGRVLKQAAVQALVAFLDSFKTWPFHRDLRP